MNVAEREAFRPLWDKSYERPGLAMVHLFRHSNRCDYWCIGFKPTTVRELLAGSVHNYRFKTIGRFNNQPLVCIKNPTAPTLIIHHYDGLLSAKANCVKKRLLRPRSWNLLGLWLCVHRPQVSVTEPLVRNFI